MSLPLRPEARLSGHEGPLAALSIARLVRRQDTRKSQASRHARPGYRPMSSEHDCRGPHRSWRSTLASSPGVSSIQHTVVEQVAAPALGTAHLPLRWLAGSEPSLMRLLVLLATTLGRLGSRVQQQQRCWRSSLCILEGGPRYHGHPSPATWFGPRPSSCAVSHSRHGPAVRCPCTCPGGYPPDLAPICCPG